MPASGAGAYGTEADYATPPAPSGQPQKARRSARFLPHLQSGKAGSAGSAMPSLPPREVKALHGRKKPKSRWVLPQYVFPDKPSFKAAAADGANEEAGGSSTDPPRKQERPLVSRA